MPHSRLSSVLVFLLARCAWGANQPATFPGSIRATLDQEYPGWALAPVSPQIRQEFIKHHVTRSPSLAVGDFDHNGEKDYVLQIVLNTPGQEEQIIIVFLGRGGAYEENIVQSMGIDPTFYLWVTHNDTLLVLGGPAGETSYACQNGQFHEVPLQEDPDHPDPTVPRL